MFNFGTRSNIICMPGIFSTKSTSVVLAWCGSVPTVAVESRFYFPVGTNIKLTDVYTTAQTVPAQLGERLAETHSRTREMHLGRTFGC